MTPPWRYNTNSSTAADEAAVAASTSTVFVKRASKVEAAAACLTASSAILFVQRARTLGWGHVKLMASSGDVLESLG